MKALWVNLLAGAGLFVVAAHADIYTWIDAAGVRHYSDTPASPNARHANVPGVQRAGANGGAPARDGKAAARGADTRPDRRKPKLIQPKAGARLANAQGRVPIAVDVGGARQLRNGEKISYYLDGRPVAQSPTAQTRLRLSNVAAGTHTLVAALRDHSRRVQRTSVITFHMQRVAGGGGTSAGAPDSGLEKTSSSGLAPTVSSRPPS